MRQQVVFAWILLIVCLTATTTTTCLIVPMKEPLTVCSANAGCMRGIHMPGYQIEQFEAYLGIPYALPPVGELRFANPKAYPRWSGTYQATTAKEDCIQKNVLLPNPVVYGNEDCLYLNVYRPTTVVSQPLGRRLPVMVYIHGGGFFSGSASPLLTGPEYFMDTQQVILVTIAYRLGALGFLSTSDMNMPGNFGLKDQNLALRWVQRNIAAFGGDPRQVTLFGQSAGAVSAHLHVLSSQSAGLFRNLITLSGSANVPFAITEQPLAQARLTAELCNISDAQQLSTVKLTRALRAVDAVTLINAGDGLKFWDVDHLTNYRPVVERSGFSSSSSSSSSSSNEAFLTEHPKRLLATGKYRPVPWLAGGVPAEGAVRAVAIMENNTLRNSFNAEFDVLFQNFLEFPTHFEQSEVQAKTERIIEEYFQGQHALNAATVQGFVDTISDRGFNVPYYNAISDYVRTVNTRRYPLYLYRFNYSGPYTFASVYTSAERSRDYGVVHCDDLIYLFRSPLLFPDFERSSTHAQVIKAFVGYFVQFAKFSKPISEPKQRPCNAATINSRPNEVCDYHEFANSEGDSFEIKTEYKVNIRRLQLWRDILEENVRTEMPTMLLNTHTTEGTFD